MTAFDDKPPLERRISDLFCQDSSASPGRRATTNASRWPQISARKGGETWESVEAERSRLCRIDEDSGEMDGDWGDRALLRLARMVDKRLGHSLRLRKLHALIGLDPTGQGTLWWPRIISGCWRQRWWRISNGVGGVQICGTTAIPGGSYHTWRWVLREGFLERSYDIFLRLIAIAAASSRRRIPFLPNSYFAISVHGMTVPTIT